MFSKKYQAEMEDSLPAEDFLHSSQQRLVQRGKVSLHQSEDCQNDKFCRETLQCLNLESQMEEEADCCSLGGCCSAAAAAGEEKEEEEQERTQSETVAVERDLPRW